jgi:ATP-binding cassette subfamily B protein
MQKETLKLFWRFTKPYARNRNLALIGVVVSVITETYLAPFVLSQFMNLLKSGNLTMATGLPLVGTYGAILFASTVVTWRITLWATWTFELKSERDLAAAILNHLMSHSLNFHANRFGGSLISQATKLTSALERFWDTIIWDFLPIVSGVTAATVILSFVFWEYAVFLFVFALAFSGAVFFGSRFLAKRSERETAAWNKVTGYVADVITNITTVKAFGSEAAENKRMQARTAEWNKRSFSTMRGFLGVSAIWATLIVVINTGSLLFAVTLSANHTIAIGTVYLLLTYTLNVCRQLWQTNHVMRQYSTIMGDAHEMVQNLMLSPDIDDTDSKQLVAKSGEIVFRDVAFAHDNGEGARVFDNFNLKIKQGERVGLVGHSGSGKTTLTRLLLRFSDIDTGTITVDGQDIAAVTQRSLREAIAYVPQEPLLFHRSLADNIAYGKPEATRDEIVKAAKRAHAWEFIQKLPEGLETMVGERGIKLSGGQRQRIAIARAMLKDASILLLDEATSALDSKSEKLIQDSLDKLMKHRTSIVIAHRLSTIAKLDRIIVLENGEVAEDGSHAELLALGGIYASLWQHQSGGFIEE